MRADCLGLALSAWIAQGAGLAMIGRSESKIAAIVGSRRLPGWVASQAIRNRKRVIPTAVGACLIATLPIVLDPRSSNLATGLIGLAIGLNVGAVAVALASIGTQARLLRLVENQADRLLDGTESPS